MAFNIRTRVLVQDERPAWLDSDQIRLITAGYVFRPAEQPFGALFIPDGHPVGVNASRRGVAIHRPYRLLSGAGWAIAFWAKWGTGGVTVALNQQTGANKALSVSVAGRAITVNLGTNADGEPNTTAAQVVEAVKAHAQAMALLYEVKLVAGGATVIAQSLPAQPLVANGEPTGLLFTPVLLDQGDESGAVMDWGRVVAARLPVGVDGLPVADPNDPADLAGLKALLPQITFA